MNNEHLEEDNIEELLQQMPKIKDERSKEDVLVRLQQGDAFQGEPSIQPPVIEKKFHWKPLLISIASLFIIVLFISKYIGTQPNMEISSGKDEAASESSMEAESKQSAVPETMENAARTVSDIGDLRRALYSDQLVDETVFTIGLAGDDAESVPISIVISKHKMTELFGDTAPTKLQLYETIAPLIDEEILGFTDYHPLQGILHEEGTRLFHTLLANHIYDKGSASIANYIGVLVDTFGSDYSEVQLVDEQGEAVVFADVGGEMEPLLLNGPNTNYNYFLYTMRNGNQYLSPNFRMSYETVTEALQNMTIEANDIYQTVILPNVIFDVKDKGDTVIIRFTEPLDLLAYDDVQVMQMVEGILLTAASFGKQVQFENVIQGEWGGFVFGSPLPVPLAANRFEEQMIFE